MAVRHGYGKIAGTDALVFAYDTGDTVNSYKGEPTTNYADKTLAWGATTQNDVIDTWSSGRVGTRLSNQPDSDGGSNALGAVGGNHTNTWIGQRTSLGAEVNGSHITFSIKLKASAATTVSLRFYQPASGGMNVGGDVTVGTEWQTYSFTVDNTSTSYVTNYLVHWILNIKTTSNTVWFYKPQVEKKSHATPFVNGTRSVTEGLKDLTGNRTIDLTNAGFNSNAELDFDGSSDYLESTTNLGPLTDLQEGTIELVFRWDTGGSGATLLHLNSGNSFYGTNIGVGNWTGATDDESIFLYFFQASGVGNTISYRDGHDKYNDGNYHHVIFTESTSNGAKLYVDGEQVVLSGQAGFFTPTTVTTLQIGRRAYDPSKTHLNGAVPVAKIYNRALTAAEVKNNYRHYKNRFGI